MFKKLDNFLETYVKSLEGENWTRDGIFLSLIAIVVMVVAYWDHVS